MEREINKKQDTHQKHILVLWTYITAVNPGSSCGLKDKQRTNDPSVPLIQADRVPSADIEYVCFWIDGTASNSLFTHLRFTGSASCSFIWYEPG